MDINPSFIDKFESFSPFDFTNNLGSDKPSTKFEKLKHDLISYFKVREDAKIVGARKAVGVSNSPSATPISLSLSKISAVSAIESICAPNKNNLPSNAVRDENFYNPLINSGESISSVQITSCSIKNHSTFGKNIPTSYSNNSIKKVNARNINSAKSLFDNFHEEFGLENIAEYEEIPTEYDNILVNQALEEKDLEESEKSDNDRVTNNENNFKIVTHNTRRSMHLKKLNLGNVGEDSDTIEVKDDEYVLHKKINYKSIKKSNTRHKYIIPTCMGKILLRCLPADYQDERRQVIGRTNKAAAALRLYPEEPRGRWGRHRSVATIQGSPYFLQSIATRISKIQQFSGEDVSIHLYKYNQIKDILEEHDIQLRRINPVDSTQ